MAVASPILDTGANLGLRLLQASWFVLPVFLAGLVHIGVIRLRWFPALANCPLDMGLTFRGRRLLGENKTVRGALTMIGAATLFAAWLAHAPGQAASRLALDPLQHTRPYLWGFLLGSGYIAGELPNSFLKRRLGIGAGETGAGMQKMFFWIFDQLDSLAGALALLSTVWRPDWAFIAVVAALALVLHPAVAVLMVALGLKSRIG